MRRRSLLIAAMLVAVVGGSSLGGGPAVAQSDAPLDGPALVRLIQTGGHVLYIRHTTRQTGDDVDRVNLTNCESQRNLTDQGRAEARVLGEAFQALNIPVGQILTSHYCRAIETARIAWGRADALPVLNEVPPGTPETWSVIPFAGLRQLLATPPAPRTNTVLVSHGPNLAQALGVELEQGEVAVFAPRGVDGFTLLGRIRVAEWQPLVAAGR